MKIAVCDDNEKERSQLSELLEVVWPDAQVFLFGDGEEILSQIRTGKSYDLVFLDIFMEKVGGIEAGKQIRELYPETEVVLVSVSREFGPEAFELNAFYYRRQAL